MNKLLLTFLVFLMLNFGFGQTNYDIQILVLAPNVTKNDRSFEKEISRYNAELKTGIDLAEQEEEINSELFKKRLEYIQNYKKSEFEFYKNLNFFKQSSLWATQYLMSKLPDSKQSQNSVVKLKDVKSTGTLTDLKAHAEQENLQFVLNFRVIEIYQEDSINYTKMKVQLYDKETDSLVIDETYIGDWSNPRHEFYCQENSIRCALNKTLSIVMEEVLRTIISNSSTAKRESQLAQERFDLLLEDYLQRTYDRHSLQNIISPEESLININDVYHVLYSSDNTKFIAFFAESFDSKDLKTFRDSKRDPNVVEVTSVEIENEFFERNSNTYVYIVKGVKYKDKWYYEKTSEAYFKAKTLLEGQQKFFCSLKFWNFFQENSTEFNPDFWETELFKKVPDVTKDPSWKYKTSYLLTKELNNRPYVGMHEIVAKRLREEKEELAIKTEKELFNKYVVPLTNKIKTQHNSEYVMGVPLNREYALIYPSDFKYFLCPILVQEPEKPEFIRYFVLVPNGTNCSIYEWTYLNPSDFQNQPHSPSILDQLNTLTVWDFKLDFLDDPKFWNEFVFVKTAESFKYLTEMK